MRAGAERFALELLLGRTTGVGGDVYTDPRFVWDKMFAAVQLVPALGESAQSNSPLKLAVLT